MEWGKVLLLLLALVTTWGSPWCFSEASTEAQQIGTTSIKNRTFTLPSNCPTSCGNISIQYPFGIGHGCYLPGFNLTCLEQNFRAPVRLLMGTLEVTSIDLPSGFVNFKSPSIRLPVGKNSTTAPLIDLKNYHNFNFWATDNFLYVSGCNVNASLVNLADNNTIIYSCVTICLDVSPDLSPYVIRRENCSIPIGKGLSDNVFLGVNLTRFNRIPVLHLSDVTEVNAYLSSSMGSLESKLSWYMDDHSSCTEAMKDTGTYACISEHSKCNNVNGSKGELGYRCKCEQGYTGDPYVPNGCQDINECDNLEKYICKGICKNTEGSYKCTCQPGTYGDPMIGECIPRTKKRTLMLALIISAGNVCLLLLCVMLVILSKKWKERMRKQIRQKNFHQNHGLLLQQLISTSEHDAERTKLFPLEEIEKATNNFDETRMLGRGGHGIVYKGILSDQRVVAIKKSTNLKKSEIDQFINEVAILSQINHKHIVKLFGCCLETEIPLLIYEFISNGTLSHHLHVPNGQSKLSWDDRLRIATEIACSLAYLHSDVSMSIFHRDVKSSNILLDDNFVAKVSDFGASRFIPLDQNYIVTVVQGTFGYLDPEYYQTSELTEKSDVYSFGVILVELLTGKAPVYSNENGDAVNLSNQFLQAMRENHALDLVEDRVLKEGNKEELLGIIQMIEMCLRLKGVERPTMKEVEYKLQGLRRIRMMKKRLPSFAEDYETTQTNLSDAFYPST